MNSFFSSNKSSLILLIISAAAFTTYALLGIPINIYWYDAGMLFIPISFVLFAILIPTTISNYYGKLKNVKLHKFMSGIDFFCVFGLSVAQLVYMFLEHGYYGFIGFLVCFFIVITAIVAFFAMIVSFHQHSLIKNQNNIRLALKLK